MPDAILKEDGFYLLQEDNSKILLETQGGGVPSPYQSYTALFAPLPKRVRNIKV